LETKITSKNRLCWVLIVLWAVIVGILFYVLIMFLGFSATFIIIALLSIVYTTISELATKTMFLFWRRSIFVYPLGSVVAYILNYFSPKYSYGFQDPYGLNFTLSLYMVFMIIFLLTCGASTLITRLVSGYESLLAEPYVASYLLKGLVEDADALLEEFLESINIRPLVVLKRGQTYFKFYSGSNQYFLSYHSINSNNIEINFVVLRWRLETLVKPNKRDMDMLLAYFESFLNKRKKESKINEWTSEFEPHYAEAIKMNVWRSYTSPLQLKEKLVLKGLISSKVIAFFRAHKKGIMTFIAGVLTVIIGELIIRYLIKVLGI